MRNLSSALDTIHNLTASGVQNHSDPPKLIAAIDSREMRYGRHGDLKPENILWFPDIGGAQEPGGILKIADLGAGKFHRRESRSFEDPRTAISTPTYEAPEIVLGNPISRAYDLWSLGCVFLEFLTWGLGGAELLDRFCESRYTVDGCGVNVDNFYTLLGHHRDGNVAVKVEIVAWIEGLRQHDWCSPFVQDALDLIQHRLLVIDAKARVSSRGLAAELDGILQRAKSDEGYLLGPTTPRGSG
jgi:serine/threonine protein kinase